MIANLMRFFAAVTTHKVIHMKKALHVKSPMGFPDIHLRTPITLEIWVAALYGLELAALASVTEYFPGKVDMFNPAWQAYNEWPRSISTYGYNLSGMVIIFIVGGLMLITLLAAPKRRFDPIIPLEGFFVVGP